MIIDYMNQPMEDMDNEIKKTNCYPCNRSNVF
jgi:hypothetical protein